MLACLLPVSPGPVCFHVVGVTSWVRVDIFFRTQGAFPGISRSSRRRLPWAVLALCPQQRCRTRPQPRSQAHWTVVTVNLLPSSETPLWSERQCRAYCLVCGRICQCVFGEHPTTPKQLERSESLPQHCGMRPLDERSAVVKAALGSEPCLYQLVPRGPGRKCWGPGGGRAAPARSAGHFLHLADTKQPPGTAGLRPVIPTALAGSAPAPAHSMTRHVTASLSHEARRGAQGEPGTLPVNGPSVLASPPLSHSTSAHLSGVWPCRGCGGRSTAGSIVSHVRSRGQCPRPGAVGGQGVPRRPLPGRAAWPPLTCRLLT